MNIRVANTLYPHTNPYRLLENLPYVDFEEGNPLENAFRLHEGVVDVALIPTKQFALHGGYVGLDFGFGSCKRTRSLYLAAREPIEELSTIYIYEDSSSSALLLQVLLAKRWKRSPRLVRRTGPIEVSDLSRHEGMLVRFDSPVEPDPNVPVYLDLGEEWYRLTKLPLVYLVWATRPGVLSREQWKDFHEIFHRCKQIRGFVAEGMAERFQVPPEIYREFHEQNFQFYFDQKMLKGLNRLYCEGSQIGLMPSSEYHCPMVSLLSDDEVKLPRRSVVQVLEDVVSGKRIGVSDAIELLQDASTGDLALVVKSILRPEQKEKQVSYSFYLNENFEEDLPRIEAMLAEARFHGRAELHVESQTQNLTEISFYEELACRIREQTTLPLQMLSIPEMILLAQRTDCSLFEVISRLVTAGVTLVSGEGGSLLLNGTARGTRSGYKSEEWTAAARELHALGVQTALRLRYGKQLTLEEQFTHLLKLRSLQDLNPGFRSYELEPDPRCLAGSYMLEDRLRLLLVMKMFLDNVPLAREVKPMPDSPDAFLGLSLGVDEIHISVRVGQLSSLRRLEAALSVLADSGMIVSQSYPELPSGLLPLQ